MTPPTSRAGIELAGGGGDAVAPRLTGEERIEIVPRRAARTRPARPGRGHDLARRGRGREATRRRAVRAAPRLPHASPAEIVAHELRTPLTSLLVGALMLVRDDLRDETRRQVALDVAADSERLTAVVEDLLALVGGDQPGAPEPLSLPHVLRSQVARAAQSGPGVRFRAYVAADVPVALADEQLLTHLIRDLLALAHAAASPGGLVEAVADGVDGRPTLHVVGRPDRRSDLGPRRLALAEITARVIARRIGADLALATTPVRVVARLELQGVAEPGDRDDG
jgi:signal transduction histidine kinase